MPVCIDSIELTGKLHVTSTVDMSCTCFYSILWRNSLSIQLKRDSSLPFWSLDAGQALGQLVILPTELDASLP